MEPESKQRLVSLLLALQCDRLCSLYYGGRGSILMFHRVVERPASIPRLHNDALEVSCAYLEMILEYLRKHFEIIPVGAIAETLAHRARRRFVCLTFDDGYLDNFTLAYPVLKKYEAPFTVYICTAFPDKTINLWMYALEDLIQSRRVIEFAEGGKSRSLEVSTREEKLAGFERVWDILIGKQGGELQDFCDRLFTRNDIDLNRYGRDLTMDWDQVRKLSQDPLVTIGAHGVSHGALGAMSDEQAEFEMAESRRMISAKIGKPVDHFAYPFGSRGAARDREFGLSRRIGFKSAVTTRRGNLFPEHGQHLECLPRLDVGKTRDDLCFLKSQLSGLRSALTGHFQPMVTN